MLPTNGLKGVGDAGSLGSGANRAAARKASWGAAERESARAVLDRIAAEARARQFREVRARFPECDARLLASARERFGVVAPFGGPTASGMHTRHSPPAPIPALASFFRDNAAAIDSVADLQDLL